MATRDQAEPRQAQKSPTSSQPHLQLVRPERKPLENGELWLKIVKAVCGLHPGEAEKAAAILAKGLVIYAKAEGGAA